MRRTDTTKKSLRRSNNIVKKYSEVTSSEYGVERRSFKATEYVDLLSRAVASNRLNPDYIDKRTAKSVIKSLKTAIDHKSRTEIANCLLQCPGAIDLTDEDGRTVIHYAFELQYMTILKFLISIGGDINAQDLKGFTVMHMCISREELSIHVNALLQIGANPNIKNKAEESPLHIAVQSERTAIIRQLLDSPQIDVDLPSYRNKRPLHICAQYDFVMELLMLLEKGANYRLPDNLGNLPIHIAVQSTSKKCAKTLFEYARSRENSKKITYKDASIVPISQCQNNQGMTPLHCAVDMGDTELVRLTLEYGSNLSIKDEEGNTAIHLSCQKSNILIFKELIKNLSKEDKFLMINTNNGAEMEAIDIDGWSPLLLAASKGAFNACMMLIEHGANTYVHGYRFRNMVHMTILGQHDNVEKIFYKLKEDEHSVYLFNEHDRWGLTPLHHAAKLGRVNEITILLECGSSCTETNVLMRSPLHLAAKHCQFTSLKRLLKVRSGESAVQYRDIKGCQALHYACQERNYDAVALLLRYGGVNKLDNIKNTTLHYAAMSPNIAILDRIFTECKELLDIENIDGDTALHVAAAHNNVAGVLFLLGVKCGIVRNRKGEFFLRSAILGEYSDLVKEVILHKRWHEIQEVMDEKGQPPFEDMIVNMPEMCEVAMDNSMISVGQPGKNDYIVAYNFNILQKQLTIESERDDDPMKRLKMMIRYGRENLIQHPLTLAYLDMKWRNYGRLMHSLGSLYYLTYLLLYSALMYFYNPYLVPREKKDFYLCNSLFSVSRDITTYMYLLAILLFLMNLIIFAKEIIKLFLTGKFYFLNVINYCNWFLSFQVLTQVSVTLANRNSATSYTLGFIALLYAWFNLLFELMRFKSIGVYVVMFVDVFKTLVKCWAVISIILVAFALTLYSTYRVMPFSEFVSLSDSKKDLIVACYQGYKIYEKAIYNLDSQEIPPAMRPFNNIIMSLFRMLFMLVGEFENIDSILEPHYGKHIAQLHFPFLTIGFTGIGAIIISTLLINLFRGLAVGDISNILHNAELRLLTEQTNWLDAWEIRFPRKFQIRCYHSQITENFSRISEEKQNMMNRSRNSKEANKADLKLIKESICALKDGLREQNKRVNKLFGLITSRKKLTSSIITQSQSSSSKLDGKS